MIMGSSFIDSWIGPTKTVANEELNPNVESLTIYFFFLYFLMATQDIAVDGWLVKFLIVQYLVCEAFLHQLVGR